jgi:hypothetical protein
VTPITPIASVTPTKSKGQRKRKAARAAADSTPMPMPDWGFCDAQAADFAALRAKMAAITAARESWTSR